MPTPPDDNEGTGIRAKEHYEEVVGINEDPETDSIEHDESQSGLHYNDSNGDDSQAATVFGSSGDDDDPECSIVTVPPYDAAQTPHFTRGTKPLPARFLSYDTTDPAPLSSNRTCCRKQYILEHRIHR
jgi:hypothetical protein